MIVTFQELTDIYNGKIYPLENQLELLSIKYKNLFGQDLKLDQNVYVIHICYNDYPTHRCANNAYREMEKEIFANRIQQKKRVYSFLEELGIETYSIIYNYENMVCASTAERGILAIRLQFDGVYLVLFKEEHYNFIRLAYKAEESPQEEDYLELLFDFDFRFDMDEEF